MQAEAPLTHAKVSEIYLQYPKTARRCQHFIQKLQKVTLVNV